MLKDFRNSPLWLIGLFIIFAQAIAGVGAINTEGWAQEALVIFVISYSSVVTLIFFAFLLWKPQNFYGPSEYDSITPDSFVRALWGLPKDAVDAVQEIGNDPKDEDALFALIDQLLIDDTKQHLILMRRCDDRMDISTTNENGLAHRYEIITRSKGFSVGMFSPAKFVNRLQGTDLIRWSDDAKFLFLTAKGKAFADWLIHHMKDAEMFRSDLGQWGEQRDISEAMKEWAEMHKKRAQRS